MIDTPRPDERERLRTAIRGWGVRDIRPLLRGPLFGPWAANHPCIYSLLQAASPDALHVNENTADWDVLFGILTPEGVAFFLPGILLHLLEGGPSEFGKGMILISLVNRLGFQESRKDSPESQAHYIDAVKACLTPEQRAIMADFAEWLHKALDEEGIGYEWLSEGFRAAWPKETYDNLSAKKAPVR